MADAPAVEDAAPSPTLARELVEAVRRIRLSIIHIDAAV